VGLLFLRAFINSRDNVADARGWSKSPRIKSNWLVVSNNVALTLLLCLIIFCFEVLRKISLYFDKNIEERI
jgi:hypothetical protein